MYCGLRMKEICYLFQHVWMTKDQTIYPAQNVNSFEILRMTKLDFLFGKYIRKLKQNVK